MVFLHKTVKISMLHKSNRITTILVPEEGQQTLLCSNKVDSCCPSLGDKSSTDKTVTDAQVDYLAGIIVEAYIYKKYEKGDR